MASSKRLVAAVAALALVGAGCRPSSEIRPAFTKETEPRTASLPGRIIFTSQLERTTESGLIDLRPGGRAAPMSLTPAPERSPALSPDGSRLAFAVVGTEGGIWVSAPDGSDPRRITTEPGSYDRPTWAPDGTRIAFAFTSGEGGNWDIYSVPADGGTPEPLTTDDGHDWYPAWSPDGSTIAYTSDADGDTAIWTLDVATKTTKKVADSRKADELPTWAPDGRRIVFSSDRDLDRWQLFAYDVGTGKTTNLFRTDAMDRFPVFSPDGRYILSSVGYLAVYRADGGKFPDGSDRWKLTDDLALSSTWGA